MIGENMVKVAIYPPNSLILADLIERKGHTPLVLQKQIRQKIKDPEIDSPPMNITEEDPIKGLKYAAIEVPSGVRAKYSPEEDEAAEQPDEKSAGKTTGRTPEELPAE